MKLGYDLKIEQTQKLSMTPELVQAIKILQYTGQDLDRYVEEQLLANPMLEKDTVSEIKKGSGETSDYRRASVSQREAPPIEQTESSEITLVEHLMFQLQFAKLDKNERLIGRYIIESLDENGYLTSSVKEMSRILKRPEKQLRRILSVIQEFEPAGIGAEDLVDCLLIQLRVTGFGGGLIEKIVAEHLEDIAANRLSLIASQTGATLKEIQRAEDIIKTLEPKPGRQFSGNNETRYIIPDAYIEENIDKDESGEEARYLVYMRSDENAGLGISSYYRRMLEENETDENLKKYLTERYRAAQWLIRSIRQRQRTIYNVIKAVIDYQVDFLYKGPKHMKTLTLKQIAEEVGIHESTVSRAINGKYMQTPRGVFEVKYFFTSGVTGAEGGISSNSVKIFIKEIIDGEDPKSPLSDQDIVSLLTQKSIKISRRTIAKYRDELGIASSSKRRRY